MAAEAYIWVGQLAHARMLAEWVLEHVGLAFFQSWAYRLLGIVHTLESDAAIETETATETAVAEEALQDDISGRAGLAKAEAAFMRAIEVAKQADIAMHEAMAAYELKIRVLDRAGREEEGEVLLAGAMAKAGGTEAQLRRVAAPYLPVVR